MVLLSSLEAGGGLLQCSYCLQSLLDQRLTTSTRIETLSASKREVQR